MIKYNFYIENIYLVKINQKWVAYSGNEKTVDYGMFS